MWKKQLNDGVGKEWESWWERQEKRGEKVGFALWKERVVGFALSFAMNLHKVFLGDFHMISTNWRF